MKHFTDRKPRGRKVAWSRKVSHNGGLLTYTLFRRDHTGRLHPWHLQYGPIARRKMIADDLRIAWRMLRERVDEIDLAGMEAA
jgi:hypothetical protein